MAAGDCPVSYQRSADALLACPSISHPMRCSRTCWRNATLPSATWCGRAIVTCTEPSAAGGLVLTRTVSLCRSRCGAGRRACSTTVRGFRSRRPSLSRRHQSPHRRMKRRGGRRHLCSRFVTRAFTAMAYPRCGRSARVRPSSNISAIASPAEADRRYADKDPMMATHFCSRWTANGHRCRRQTATRRAL